MPLAFGLLLRHFKCPLQWDSYDRLTGKYGEERVIKKKSSVRLLFSGFLPLFILAHFGHHVVGAMLRPLMPMIRTDLSLNYTEVGVVISAFAITSGISQLPAGWLADRFEARKLILISISGVALAGILIGLAPSYSVLITFLVIAAMLGGGYHPASSAVISSSVPAEYRGRALGFHLIGGSSTFWIVPLLATPIAVAWGWNSAYIFLSIPAVFLGIVLYIFIGRRGKAQELTLRAGVGQATGNDNSVNWRRLLPFFLMSILTGTILRSVVAYFSLYAVDHLGVTEATAALLVTITPAVGLLAAPLGGYLSDRIGTIPILLTLSFMAAPIVYILGLVSNVSIFIVVMIVIGFINFTRGPTSESFIAVHTPQHRRSTILGIYFFANAEVSGLLTPVVGRLIDWRGFKTSFNIVSISLAAVVAICSVFIWRNRNQSNTEYSAPS
ncbi:MFS transporter [Chloroflexota bacterium]